MLNESGLSQSVCVFVRCRALYKEGRYNQLMKYIQNQNVNFQILMFIEIFFKA